MIPSYSEPQLQRSRSRGLWHLAAVTASLWLLSYAAGWLNAAAWGSRSISILWPSTGILLGVLLRLPRNQWAKYIAAGFAVDLMVNLLPPLRHGFTSAVYEAGCNVVEVSLAAFLLYRAISPKPDLTQRRQLIRLLAYGMVLAPAVASLLASMCMDGRFGRPQLQPFEAWYTGDALGIAIMTPLYLSLSKRSWFMRRSWFEIVPLFAALFGLSWYVFWQDSLPLLFVIFPVLLLLEVRLGLAGSAVGLLVLSVIGGYFTAAGSGPIGLAHITTLSQRTLMLQFFTFTCMIVLYIMEVVIAERDRFELSLIASESRFRLLAEGSYDIIVLTNLNRERLYISPAVKKLLGWEPEEFLPLEMHQVIHPGDLTDVQKLYSECHAEKPVNTRIYRCMRKDGSYIWMEANLALYRDPETGEPAGFINVVRDISSRKAVEDQLSKALNAAENLASIDSLTGLANRRSFDEFIESEWIRGIRRQTDFSLLLVDVDHFKLYNDRYGHVTGDNCLKEIAEVLRSVVQRSTDLLARYGGEEFIVVLPGTDSKGAQLVAEQIRRAVELREIVHERGVRAVVTLSIGCATQRPSFDSPSGLLIKRADDALYLAKSAGRNCVRTAGVDASEVAVGLDPRGSAV